MPTRVDRLKARRSGRFDRLLAWLRLGEHENGALAWSGRLALLVAGAGTVVVVSALLTIVAIPDAEPVAGVVAICGGVAIFVAVLGRVSTVVEQRYADVPLAQPPGPDQPPPRAARQRGTLRRRSGVAYATAAIGSLFVLPYLWYGGADDLIWMSIGIAIIGAAVLAGPSARFVVTPEHLHIDTVFHRISVPRRLIGTFERSGLEIRLRLTDADFYDLRVDSPILDIRDGDRWRLNSRCLVRTAERLAALLHEVPAAPATGGAVEIRRRTGMLVFTAVAVLVTAAPIALSFTA